MLEHKVFTSGAELKTSDAEAGQIEAILSTFGVVDRGGDIVEASAFTEGQEVPLVWAHDWSKPIGKGVVRVEAERAIFVGSLWLDTQDGAEAYKKIKNAGALQEYSWGFMVLDADFAERDGQTVRIIKRTEMFEASPVLVGEGRGTRTLSLKNMGLPLADHSSAVLAAVEELAARLKSHADLRVQKEGRVLSEANRDRLKAHRDALQTIATDLDGVIAATAPKPKGDGKAARALRAATLRRATELRLLAS